MATGQKSSINSALRFAAAETTLPKRSLTCPPPRRNEHFDTAASSGRPPHACGGPGWSLHTVSSPAPRARRKTLPTRPGRGFEG